MNELSLFLSYGFIQRALLAGSIMALVATVLGVFVLMRRMSFFSDAMAHASLLGIAIAFLLAIQPVIGAIVGSVLVSLLIAFLIRQKKLSADTVIGVVFSGSVATAIFLISFLHRTTIDLTSLLFGDILAVSNVDVWLAVIVLLLTLVFIRRYTKPMLVSTFHEDLVKLEYKNARVVEALFLGLLAFVIAVSLKMIGAILVSALIIVPAATAQNISKNVRQMFFLSALTGILSVVSGMYLSWLVDSPSGATIILVASFFFVLSLLFRKT